MITFDAMSMNSTKSSPASIAEATYNKAVKAEVAREFNKAYRLYTEAAELYLNLVRVQPEQSAKWKTNAGKAIGRAEKIKQFASTQQSVHLTPPAGNQFADHIQSSILRKGEKINGSIYPLWSEPANRVPSSQHTSQPKLSPAQLTAKAEWRTPPPDCDLRALPQEVVQQIVTDCSVSASLSALLLYARRFTSFKRILEDILQSSTGDIVHLKLFLNGAWRRAAVDTKLPYDPCTGKLLCMASSNPQLLWPSLVEKGYMQLMGGYDFPGSDSGIDIHALCGWIPEHISFRSPNFQSEKSWTELNRAFDAGECVVTCGTGADVRDEALLPAHSYAITDIREAAETEVRTIDILDTVVDGSNGGYATRRTLDWAAFLRLFDGLYLSCRVDLFKHQLVYHGSWKTNTSQDQLKLSRLTLTFKPDPTHPKESKEILIHLNRHITDSTLRNEYISLNVQFQDEVLSLSSHVLDVPPVDNSYTSNPHVLTRITIPTNITSGTLSILCLYDGNQIDPSFTLSAFSNGASLSWDEARSQKTLPCVKKIQGAFTTKTAGGNSTLPSFMLNPQYRLRVHPVQGGRRDEKVQVSVTLRGGSREVPFGVLVARAEGRVFDLARKDLILHSGSYSYGVARVGGELSPGEYTIAVSTFEPQQLESFALSIESSHPLDVSDIPLEGAGMYSHVIKGSWDESTGMGGPSFKQYTLNPIYELTLPVPGQVKIRLQVLEPSPTTYINVSVYSSTNVSSPAALGTLRSTSGTYSNTNSGAVTNQVQLPAGTYWVIPSTFTPGTLERFKLLVYSSVRGVSVRLRDPL